MKRVLMVAAVIVLVPAAFAQSGGMKGMEMKDMPMTKADGKAGETHKGKATVKSVDAGNGTVSLSHEPIQSMNWPAMTMKFKAADKAMLKNVKPGAKVEFSFVQSGKDYVIMDIK
jgi:Cu(I)/Ag(I) efflux system protein CusF